VILAGVALAAALSSASAPVAEDVRPWTVPGISSERFESHPAFDPRTGDLYFVRSAKDFSGWRILVARCGPRGWTTPVEPPFAGPGLEADPFFAADGRSLYFISTRGTGGTTSEALDIWRVERDAAGTWGSPRRLPAPVNSDQAEWFPRPARDGWLYFGSARPGGLGQTDIWRARDGARGNEVSRNEAGHGEASRGEASPAVAGRWRIENLGPSINTPGHEYEPLPSPDGTRLIVAAEEGFHEARRRGNGWAPRVRLGPAINVNGSEIGPLFSPSGRSLLFARDFGAPRSGEFVLWRRGAAEAWPPSCPPR
jgi:Tol biopolymer transport system component